MQKLKYAIIGCGRISPNHIAAYQNNSEELELVAVCDIVADNMKNLLKKFDMEKSIDMYIDYNKMLQDKKPDLVAIATESGKHAGIALDVIAHGANLIIEKPIALSLSDADAIIQAADEKGVVLCACHQNRFNK
ncbi:MAG: oxidoreductase domain protein, partial [Oscillospiraceae bacterium]|nr:oxidoreductase domain protein [Oscillospiraceae bacterium]